MLYGIPPHLPAELLRTLASMGHGDEIALVDANYPAAADARHTHVGHPLELAGRDLIEATADVLALMPLDTFDEAPVSLMAFPGEKVPSVHADVTTLLERVPGGPWIPGTIERFAFYERAREAFALVRTLERRPYGNVILKKGVLTPDGELMTPASAGAVG